MASSRRILSILVWILQILLALLFLLVGVAKFGPHNAIWVEIFAAIGIGQWFRVFTGVLEILCAILLTIPRTAAVAAALLSCTMVGAFFVRLFVLHGPARDAITPLVYLALLFIIFWRRRDGLPGRAHH
ncbi:MAG TPA: DoxX family protein [Candidatus Acidoferrales bacterium]|nr:DoxX family protein [Candidatus Acidoferrales bacterium]